MGLFRTNFRLWIALGLLFFVLLGFQPLVRNGDTVFNFWTAWALVFSGGAIIGTPADTGLVLMDVGFRFAVVAIAAAWLIQRVALGLRSWWLVPPQPPAPPQPPGLDFSQLPQFPDAGA